MAPIHHPGLSAAVRNGDLDQVISLISNAKWSSSSSNDACSDYNVLFKAVRLGRKRIVNLLLEKGSRAVMKPGSSSSLLHVAVARMGWSSVVEKLVSLGARVSDKNSQGDTALHLAFVNGSTDRMVDLLLTKYLDETIENVKNNDGLSFLHIACTRSTLQLVQEFIDRGVDDIDCQVNLQSNSQYAGCSPLHFAVMFGRYEIAALLLRSGASVYVQDSNGSTPVHLALYTANQQMIDLLFAHDHRNENFVNNFGLTHFMAACAGSMPHIVDEFLYERLSTPVNHLIGSRVRDLIDHPYAGYSPIHFAVEFGNSDTVQLLLDYGASCFSMCANNCSPMAIAYQSGFEDILLLLQRYAERENEILLAGQVDRLTLYIESEWPIF